MLKDYFRQLRFYLGNTQKFLSSPWRQWNIDPEYAINIFACNFGDGGWHHLRRTLEEFDRDPLIKQESTTLWRYLKKFQPENISALCGINENRLPPFTYPWGTFKKGILIANKSADNSRFCGPSTDDFISCEFRDLTKLYLELRKTGYRPNTYPNSFIGGTWLIDLNGNQRFVVLQGNHRMAVLSHMGYKRIAVRVMPGYLGKIHEKFISEWPLVSRRICSESDAQQIFRFYFEENGFHVARLIQMCT